MLSYIFLNSFLSFIIKFYYFYLILVFNSLQCQNEYIGDLISRFRDSLTCCFEFRVLIVIVPSNH